MPSNIGILRESLSEFSEDKAPRLAAALAYYSLFAIAPLLVIAITIAAFVFGPKAARGEIIGQIQGYVGSDAAESIQTMIRGAAEKRSGGVWASIGGTVVLLFGASAIVGHLKESMNAIWSVPEAGGGGLMGTIRDRIRAIVIVLCVGLFVLVIVAVSSALSAVAGVMNDLLPLGAWFWEGINLIVSAGAMTLLFALIYRYIPDETIEWRDVWIGSAFTAVLFVVGKFGLGFYLGRGSVGSAYGAAGSLVVLILWLYYSSLIFFLGAEFTEVFARYHHGIETREQKRRGRQVISAAPANGWPEPDAPRRSVPRSHRGWGTLWSVALAGAAGMMAGVLLGLVSVVVGLARAARRLFR